MRGRDDRIKKGRCNASLGYLEPPEPAPREVLVSVHPRAEFATRASGSVVDVADIDHG